MRRGRELLLSGNLKKEDYVVRKAPHGEIVVPSIFCDADVAREVLQENTLYPLAAAVGLAARATTSFTPTTNWKICTQCVIEDIENHGIAYIRRQNTIKSIQLCSKHATELFESCPTCKKKITQHSNFGFQTCSIKYDRIATHQYHSPRHQFAKFIDDLVKYEGKPHQAHSLGIIAFYKLRSSGYRKDRFDIDIEKAYSECNKLLNINNPIPSWFLQGTNLFTYTEMAFFAFRKADIYLHSISSKEVWDAFANDV